MGEHLPCKQGVRGSNPLTSTILFLSLPNKGNRCVLEFLKKEISIEEGKVLILNKDKDKSPFIIGDKNRGNVSLNHSSILSSISVDKFLNYLTLKKIMGSYIDNHICPYITERNDPISVMDANFRPYCFKILIMLNMTSQISDCLDH